MHKKPLGCQPLAASLSVTTYAMSPLTLPQSSLFANEFAILIFSFFDLARWVNLFSLSMKIEILPHSNVVCTIGKDYSSKSIGFVIHAHAFKNLIIFYLFSTNAMHCENCAFFEEAGSEYDSIIPLFELEIFGVDGEVVEILVLKDRLHREWTQRVPDVLHFL